MGAEEIGPLLEAWGRGEPAALTALVARCQARVRALAKKALREFPRVRRWEETDDVAQNALLRLWKALRECKPATPHQLLGLTALHIRWELLALKRRLFGEHGIGTHHLSRAGEPLDPAESKARDWFHVHEHVDSLPEPERTVVDLLVYQGLRQAEAASVLGVSVRTVQNRYATAKLLLKQTMPKE